LFDELCELKHLISIEVMLISIGGVLIVGGIILLFVLILRKKERMRSRERINNNTSMKTIH
jgi:hypothetical protein